jgi:choline monooxygenase
MTLAAEQTLAGASPTKKDAVALPAAAYTDPLMLETERKRIFEAGWVSVGSAQQLLNPGDLRPVTMAGHSLLLVHDRDHTIRVFHNVCRHRGAALITEATHARGGVITCPYHRWGYGLDGTLKAAPYFDGSPKPVPEDRIRSQMGLVPVRSAVWLETIFVNLSGNAEPFEEFIRPLSERWKGFDLSQLRLAGSMEFEPAANWKFVVENFLDLYHLPFVHAQLGDASQVYHSEPTYLSDDIFGYVMPTFDAARAETGPMMPLFPELPKKFEYALDLIYIFPNTGIVLTPSWSQVMIIHPDGPVRSRQILDAYLVGDTLMNDESKEAREGFMGLLREVNTQDIEILRKLQMARTDSAQDQGLFAPWDELTARLARRVSAAAKSGARLDR